MAPDFPKEHTSSRRIGARASRRTVALEQPLDPSPFCWFMALLDQTRNGGCGPRSRRYVEKDLRMACVGRSSRRWIPKEAEPHRLLPLLNRHEDELPGARSYDLIMAGRDRGQLACV